MSNVSPVTLSSVYATLMDVLGNYAPEKDMNAYQSKKSIQEELDIDSFDYLNFLIELESLYGITVPEDDYDQLVSLNDVISYVLDRS